VHDREDRRRYTDDILVPDLGGWRRERMPVMTTELPYFDLAPDGVCEVLSGSTKN
jgi:hypothetical protein